MPLGGNGNGPEPTIVKTKVQRAKLLGRTNWNTDFVVTKPYNSYKFFLHRRLHRQQPR